MRIVSTADTVPVDVPATSRAIQEHDVIEVRDDEQQQGDYSTEEVRRERIRYPYRRRKVDAGKERRRAKMKKLSQTRNRNK